MMSARYVFMSPLTLLQYLLLWGKTGLFGSFDLLGSFSILLTVGRMSVMQRRTMALKTENEQNTQVQHPEAHK